MRVSVLAIALALASTSAFGFENQDYTFKVLVQTGQTISGYQLAQLTDPAINNLNNVIFTAYAKAPIGSSTFFAGLFSPEAQIAPYTGSSGTPCLAPYAINDANQIAFVQDAKLSPTESFVSGIYETTYTGGTVQTLLAPGAVVDGVALTGNLCSSNSTGNLFAFDDAGRVAFGDTGGLYKYRPGKGVNKININKIDGEPLTQIAVANGPQSELVFQGTTQSFGAIFTRDRLLVKTPEEIYGVKVASIFLTQAARNDKFVFEGIIGSPSANDYGLFTRDRVIAQSGHKVGGKVISTAGAPFFGSPAINSRGEVAFAALTGAGTYPQDLAIFSCDSVLVAVGDTISGHTVSSLDNPVMNDYGVIAFLASFTDGSQAIVEATKRWR
jgi:hypothetical protein